MNEQASMQSDFINYYRFLRSYMHQIAPCFLQVLVARKHRDGIIRCNIDLAFGRTVFFLIFVVMNMVFHAQICFAKTLFESINGVVTTIIDLLDLRS